MFEEIFFFAGNKEIGIFQIYLFFNKSIQFAIIEIAAILCTIYRLFGI